MRVTLALFLDSFVYYLVGNYTHVKSALAKIAVLFERFG